MDMNKIEKIEKFLAEGRKWEDLPKDLDADEVIRYMRGYDIEKDNDYGI